MSTTVTTKGQVTIPKEVRETLGLRTGDELEFAEENGQYRLRKVCVPDRIKKYRGYLGALAGSDPDKVVEEMREK